jgi:hypothetical protein
MTYGTALVTTTGVTKNETFLQELGSDITDPVDAIVSAFGLDVKVDLVNAGGKFLIDVDAQGSATYSVNFFTSETIAGVAVSAFADNLWCARFTD